MVSETFCNMNRAVSNQMDKGTQRFGGYLAMNRYLTHEKLLRSNLTTHFK